jgi:hypothetical protein
VQKSRLGVDQPEIASGLLHPIGEEGVVLLSLVYLILRAALRLFVGKYPEKQGEVVSKT